MNGSLTIVLCAAVAWAIGLGGATEAGLKPQEDLENQGQSPING